MFLEQIEQAAADFDPDNQVRGRAMVLLGMHDSADRMLLTWLSIEGHVPWVLRPTHWHPESMFATAIETELDGASLQVLPPMLGLPTSVHQALGICPEELCGYLSSLAPYDGMTKVSRAFIEEFGIRFPTPSEAASRRSEATRVQYRRTVSIAAAIVLADIEARTGMTPAKARSALPAKAPKPPSKVPPLSPNVRAAAALPPILATAGPVADAPSILASVQPRLIDRSLALVRTIAGTFVPVAQVQGLVGAAPLKAKVIAEVHAWLAEKGVHCPVDGGLSESWESGTDGSALQVWSESDDTRTAIRFDQPCTQVPGRIWRVELVVQEANANVYLGGVVRVLVQHGVHADTMPSVPRVLTQIADRYAMIDDERRLTREPWTIDSVEDLAKLQHLIALPSRGRSVVVIPLTANHGGQRAAAVRLARRTVGYAHVVILAPSLMANPPEAIGQLGELAAGEVRIYLRGASATGPEAHRHLKVPASIWSPGSPHGVDLIAAVVAHDTVSSQDVDNDVPSFARTRQLIQSDRARKASSLADGATQAAMAQIEQLLHAKADLQSQLEHAIEMASEEERRRQSAESTLREAEQENWALQSRVEALEHQLRSSAGMPEALLLPETWDALESWVNQQFEGRLVLTKQAMRMGRDSVFEDLPYLAEVLGLLADQYWQQKVYPSERVRDAFMARCAELRVEVCKVGLAATVTRTTGQYRTTHEGRSYLCDLHVSGSSSRDRRKGLRVYFAFDEDRSRVVVGSLPDHLRNSLS